MEDSEVLLLDSEKLTGCGGTLPCDPRRRLHRYLILILICFLSFGSYFCYDNPSALENQIMHDMQLTGSQYMNFYSWYSWPNVILSFAGGFLIDKVLGIRLGSIIFSLFVFGGQLIFAGGAYTNAFWLCIVGRFVFGIGGESLAVGQNTYASAWFDDSELNFIFGLQLSMSRIGSTVNLNTMGLLYKSLPDTGYKKLGQALFIASVTCLFSLACALVLALFDLRAERILKRKEKKEGDTEEQVIKLSDIRYFSPAFWLICGICVSYYVAVFPFISLSKIFFIQKYGLSDGSAALYTSLVYIVSAASSPISGIMIDYTGCNLYWVAGGTMATLGCHALLAFTWTPAVAVTVLMGISYSILASSLWPMVALIVPMHQRGTAFGIMQSVQNLGLGVIGLLAGYIQDKFGFLVLIVFFCMCLCLAFLLIVILFFWDAQNGVRLNETGKNRRSKIEKTEFTVSQTVET